MKTEFKSSHRKYPISAKYYYNTDYTVDITMEGDLDEGDRCITCTRQEAIELRNFLNQLNLGDNETI